METVILVIHLVVALALIGVVMLLLALGDSVRHSRRVGA